MGRAPVSGWAGRFGYALTRARARYRDMHKGSRIIAVLSSVQSALFGRMPWLSGERRYELLVIAMRRAAYCGALPLVRLNAGTASRLLERLGGRTTKAHWPHYAVELQSSADDQVELTTSLILREPKNGAPGVLYCSFEYNWIRLLTSDRARRLFDEYVIVGASSWSPPDFACLQAIARVARFPAFIGISHESDMALYRLADPRLVPVPLLASDWIRPEVYPTRPWSERTIDVISVAHWGTFKRHWLLFQALAEIPGRLRVALLGRSDGQRTQSDLRREAEAFGVRHDLEFHEDVPHTRVRELLSQAKVSVICSAREGSCVAVTESLFADVPMVMVEGSHVGSIKYVGPGTGVLAAPGDLHRAITELLASDGTLRPRATIEALTSAARSSAALCRQVREELQSRGVPAGGALEPMCWDYVPTYLDAAASRRFEQERARLRQQYGIRLREYRAGPVAPTQ